MKIIEDSILAFCWKILDKIEVGNKILVSDYAKKDPKLFINCCKLYIDVYGNMMFNKDYTELYKVYSFKEIEDNFTIIKK